ncbi:D-amino-acid oxidase [Eremomyces bilateralis CBS 781.70]|uniref:D-amino-acid oxidase n=1 Tax=Eremomyces bilateralis CBS 781.70 TaxID=1392243 RepID=A0A6G1FXH2_9PEZI|nr:D-amino-acid oxidase [Eremomyces bilateralis CBS 781.70]KAF1810366.1 D-amino-acid oxidase [Eremomyces bilateralis CBS 781.70]
MANNVEMNICVLGAGVIGLTCALNLSAKRGTSVTVLAKHMPGDYDVEYASPWAGANFLPYGAEGTLLAQLERETWPELQRLVNDVPDAAIHYQPVKLYNRAKDAGSPTGEWFSSLMKENPWYQNLVPDFRVLSPSELPEGVDSGKGFTSVCINSAVYLPWLVSQCLKNGVVFKRAVVSHLSEVYGMHHTGKQADIAINCTGLSSLKLGGVMDTKLFPGRGQIVVVRNEAGVMPSISGTDDGGDEVTYIMERAAGGGTILGGCFQKHSWESQPDPNLAIRIMKRAVALCPSLTNGKGIEALSIIRHGVGLRPLREGGPRVEKERFDGKWVVHCYGHGGYGYQSSYGSALEVERLVDSIQNTRAKL